MRGDVPSRPFTWVKDCVALGERNSVDGSGGYFFGIFFDYLSVDPEFDSEKSQQSSKFRQI